MRKRTLLSAMLCRRPLGQLAARKRTGTPDLRQYVAALAIRLPMEGYCDCRLRNVSSIRTSLAINQWEGRHVATPISRRRHSYGSFGCMPRIDGRAGTNVAACDHGGSKRHQEDDPAEV